MHKRSNNSAFPFETIATAIALSPRAENILHESKRLAEQFNAELILIHVGKKTEEKKNKLDALLNKAGINKEKPTIVWKDGAVAESILDSCKNYKVDLLVFGAIDKESLYKYYVGSVARDLCRKAKCSLLLITSPLKNGQRFNHIVVNGVQHPKTKSTVNTALYFSQKTFVKELTIVGELTSKKAIQHDDDNRSVNNLNRERNKIIQEEENRLTALFELDKDEMKFNISRKYIFGKIGHSIGLFAQTVRADLLVVNSPNKKLGLIDRLFPHDIEYILGDLPCNLLIVHTRNIE